MGGRGGAHRPRLLPAVPQDTCGVRVIGAALPRPCSPLSSCCPHDLRRHEGGPVGCWVQWPAPPPTNSQVPAASAARGQAGKPGPCHPRGNRVRSIAHRPQVSGGHRHSPPAQVAARDPGCSLHPRAFRAIGRVPASWPRSPGACPWPALRWVGWAAGRAPVPGFRRAALTGGPGPRGQPPPGGPAPLPGSWVLPGTAAEHTVHHLAPRGRRTQRGAAWEAALHQALVSPVPGLGVMGAQAWCSSKQPQQTHSRMRGFR